MATRPNDPSEADLRLVQFDTDTVKFAWKENGVKATPSPTADYHGILSHYDIPGYIVVIPMSIVSEDLLLEPNADSLAVAGFYMFEIEKVEGSFRSTNPTNDPINVHVRDDLANAPMLTSMVGANTQITEASLDTSDTPLGAVPTGSVISVFRDGQPEASVTSANGTFSLGVVSGATYTVYVHFPGFYWMPKEVEA